MCREPRPHGQAVPVVEPSDDRDQGTAAQNRDGRRLRQPPGQTEKTHACQDDGDEGQASALRGWRGVRAALVGHVNERVRQGVAADCTSEQEGAGAGGQSRGDGAQVRLLMAYQRAVTARPASMVWGG